MYALAIDTFVPVLSTLPVLLDKGADHARSKGIDLDTLVSARLAPDGDRNGCRGSRRILHARGGFRPGRGLRLEWTSPEDIPIASGPGIR